MEMESGARFLAFSILSYNIQRIFNFFVEYGFYFIERSGKYLSFMSGKTTNEIIFFTSPVK